MKRINIAIQKAAYSAIRAVLEERGEWRPAAFAITWEAIGRGLEGDVQLFDSASQLNAEFYKSNSHLNPETARSFVLNHAAGLAI